VALLAVLRMLPYVLLGFGMGALADALDRKSLLIASLLVMALVSGAMALLTLSGAAGYALVAAATMASGAFWTTDMPVRRQACIRLGAQRAVERCHWECLLSPHLPNHRDVRSRGQGGRNGCSDPMSASDPLRKFELGTPLAVGTWAVSGTSGRRMGGKCGTSPGSFSG
jgi:hypothetical protein